MISSKHTPVDEILLEIPPISATKIHEWIATEVMGQGYLIFDKVSGIATCTRCSREMEMYSIGPYGELEEAFPKIKHNAELTCPECGAELIAKSYGLGRKKLNAYFRIAIPQVEGQTVYITVYMIIADYSGRDLELHKWIQCVYKINEYEQTGYKHSPANEWNPEEWKLMREVKLPQIHGVYGTDTKFTHCLLYDKEIPEIFKDTVFARRLLPGYVISKTEWPEKAEMLISLLSKGAKYPAIEMMLKGGMPNMAEGYLKGYRTRWLNIRGKNLSCIIRGNMQDVRNIRAMNLTMNGFDMYQEVKKLTGVRAETYDWLRKCDSFIRDIKYSDKIHENIIEPGKINWRKAIDYIIAHNIRTYEFRDWLNQMIELDMPFKSRDMFPKDFRKAHQKASEIIEIKQDEILRAKFKEALKGCTQATIIDGFIFYLASDPQLIIDEGKAQHHCVATYVDRVSNGRCYIYLVRKASDPEKAFYTLELSPEGKVVQCRGLKNCNMTEDVEAAVKQFESHMCKELSKKEKSA